MTSRFILGLRVDVTSYAAASQQILRWSDEPVGRAVCCANVHMVTEGHRDPLFRAAVNSADLITADGVPLLWLLRASGAPHAPRVYGPDLMQSVLALAAESQTPVGFYGATESTLANLRERAARRHPGLRVVYSYAPPFRDLTPREETQVLGEIAASGARILFVGLGCPKQERWMARHREALPCVLLGVGAAFDQLAGTTPRAPAWLQAAGCEWLFRLAIEPRRLWRRYLWSNTAFLLHLTASWLRTGSAIAREARS